MSNCRSSFKLTTCKRVSSLSTIHTAQCVLGLSVDMHLAALAALHPHAKQMFAQGLMHIDALILLIAEHVSTRI